MRVLLRLTTKFSGNNSGGIRVHFLLGTTSLQSWYISHVLTSDNVIQCVVDGLCWPIAGISKFKGHIVSPLEYELIPPGYGNLGRYAYG